MATASLLQGSLGICAHVQAVHDKGDTRQMHYGFSNRSLPRLDTGSSSRINYRMLSTKGRAKFWPPSYVKASHSTLAVASDSVATEGDSQGELDSGNQTRAQFPDSCEVAEFLNLVATSCFWGFFWRLLKVARDLNISAGKDDTLTVCHKFLSLYEQNGLISSLASFIMEVCDETSVAEIKLKAGNFEMHMRRNIEKTKQPSSATAPLTPPPIPSKPMVDSDPVVSTPAPSSDLPKPPPAKSSDLLINKISMSEVPKVKSEILEDAGHDGLCFVTSPKVGIFRRSRIAKGKVGPVLCKEGQTIKEGQVVCYLEQFSASAPVVSNVSGEVIRVLWNDGEPVGYGDPLFAVLPSFHGIK